jgi:hypothetical protein
VAFTVGGVRMLGFERSRQHRRAFVPPRRQSRLVGHLQVSALTCDL